MAKNHWVWVESFFLLIKKQPKIKQQHKSLNLIISERWILKTDKKINEFLFINNAHNLTTKTILLNVLIKLHK